MSLVLFLRQQVTSARPIERQNGEVPEGCCGPGPEGRGVAWASTVRFGPVLKSVWHESMIEQSRILLVLDWELDF